MARPSITDLTDKERRVEVALFQPRQLALYPAMSKAMAEFVDAAQRAEETGHTGVEIVTEWDGLHVYAPKTDSELNETLATKQQVWDYRQKQYDRLMAGEDALGASERSTAERHAETENLPLPTAQIGGES
jgi:hypothetical protein